MTHGENVDFRGARLDDPDFSDARLHGASFEGARLTEVWLGNARIEANISGSLDGLRINGVEIAPLVEAELDRQYPDRVKLRATDPSGLLKGWTMVEDVWRTTTERAQRHPRAVLHGRVDDDWSFVETLRHLIFAHDCWLNRMVRGEPHPYHQWGLAGPWLSNPSELDIDPIATPSFDEVLQVRHERLDVARATYGALTPTELDRVCVPPDTPGHPMDPHTVRECVQTILEEEWEHARYANRDLDALAPPA